MAPHSGGRRRSKASAFAVALLGALLFASFLSLGTWQMQRRSWKHELIARIGERVHAPPASAPGPDEWPQITAASAEYRHVRVAGRYLHDQATLVQAATKLGAGFWLLTPLRAADGTVVLVNRGFVPGEAEARAAPQPLAEVTLTGLLRISEPSGAFLRDNDPAANRWHSRDVAAIATARRLDQVAPYFVDADADPRAPAGAPVGGLTVVQFNDNHLVYALTWYALAAMVVAGAWRVVRREHAAPSGD